MEERERQARKGAGGRASALARWVAFVGASAAVVAVAVMAGPAGGSRHAPATVTANNYSFSPPEVVINQGETVTWTNAGGSHNVVIEAESFESPSPEAPPGPPNWPVTHAFNTPGTFTYYCRPHRGLGMTGTVTVVPPGGGTPPPGGGTPPPRGGTPPPGGGGNPPPGGLANTTVTLRVSDTTPARGARVRFFGTVRPARDGRLLQLQRRARGGSYLTVARIRLTDAGSARSKFSKRLRVMGDAVFRARLPADRAHEVGVSRAKRLNVP